jgi:hypothetical protein
VDRTEARPARVRACNGVRFLALGAVPKIGES